MADQHGSSPEDRLAETLQTLPRMKARQDFTANVLQRIETPRPRHWAWPWTFPKRWVPLVAAALVVAAVTWTAHQAERDQRRHAAMARIETLQDERRALSDELDMLRSLAGQSRPVLYLGADQGVDLVYDLSRLKKGDRVEIPAYLKDQQQLQRLEEEIPLADWPLVAPRGMTALGMPSQIFSSTSGDDGSTRRRTLY